MRLGDRGQLDVIGDMLAQNASPTTIGASRQGSTA
jgi:hypothetical protein